VTVKARGAAQLKLIQAVPYGSRVTLSVGPQLTESDPADAD
jgi:hypothetical protein